MAPKKLNSMRFLEQHRIPYEAITFDDSIHTADGVAEAAGVSPAVVYKTLVTLSDEPRSKPMLVLVNAERQVDLKMLARAVGQKKVQMAAHAEAEKLTGLKVGGISALALTQKSWPVYMDQTVVGQDEVLVSAGQRGMDLRLKAEDLIRVLAIEIIACSTPA